jgi:hypothetical protein
MADFVVADDVFWRRTCSDDVRAKYQRQGRPLPPAPVPVPEVQFADKSTVADVLGAAGVATGTQQSMRQMRLQVMLHLERQGVIRPLQRTQVPHRVRAQVGQCNVHVCRV